MRRALAVALLLLAGLARADGGPERPALSTAGSPAARDVHEARLPEFMPGPATRIVCDPASRWMRALEPTGSIPGLPCWAASRLGPFLLQSGQAPSVDSSEMVAAGGEDGGWSFSASAFAYFVPEDRNYLQPTLAADRGWLHLEARYQYEDLDTGSAWIGYNVSVGRTVSFEITPMVGAVFGETDGIAPGYAATLGWKRLELYSEGEYVVDLDDSSDSFFYNWSEVTFSFTDAFRMGFVGQRTRAYRSSVEIERGVLAGLAVGPVDAALYVFNLGWEDPSFVVAVGVAF